jgi:hypothetical protein
MVTTADRPTTWELLRNSGEPRPITSVRADAVMTVAALWFTLGLFLDAYAHANLSNLESFFTPWHAVFYSGFAVTAGWILWTIWGYVRQGRRGMAAVPVGYGAAVIALPGFAVSGGADLLWHELIGIETTTNIFFSPSHLGLFVSMVTLLTCPLRAAWAREEPGTRPALGQVLPAMLTLAMATSLALLFVTYGNALLYGPNGIIGSLSDLESDGPDRIAASVVITTLVLVGPLLLLARRWYLPRGTATLLFALSAAISSVLTGFENLEITVAAVVAGVLVDVLAAVLRPAGHRRLAYWAFGGLVPVLTWAAYLFAASVTAGALPAVTEFWTGLPLVAGLVGWGLAVLLLPNAQPLAGSVVVRADASPERMA